MLKQFFTPNVRIAAATLLGLAAGYANLPLIDATASAISEIFINLLKLVSLPIIFFSILSTASGMNSVREIKILGKPTIQYTLATTLIAAAVALSYFLLIDPVSGITSFDTVATDEVIHRGSYYDYLIKSIPSNIIQPFSENHVIGVLFMALLFSLATLSLPQENRATLHSLFSSLYAAIMKVTGWIVLLMPLAIWAFITLFFKDLRSGLEIKSLGLYLLCVLAANFTQALIVLPTFLKAHGISPIRMAKGMLPSLSVAFFTKSSSAALPMAMRCAQENVGIAPKVANFTLPLCTTINMNACAAFILTTVLFVSIINGVHFSGVEMALWIVIATVAAVGNAGVPMGCYFLSGAFLAAMDVPLNILGVILPFYTMIDMVESAINVWSDACVTAIVDKKVAQENQEGIPELAISDMALKGTRCC